MRKVKPIMVRTPEELARSLGLAVAEAKEWQVQHAMSKRLKEIVGGQNIIDAKITKLAGISRTRVTTF